MGAVAGTIRLFIGTSLEQIQKQVKDLYGISISPKIRSDRASGKVELRRQFLRCDPVKTHTRLALALRPIDRPELLFPEHAPACIPHGKGRQNFQQATYVNGEAYSFAGGLPVYNGIPTATIPEYNVGSRTIRRNGTNYTEPSFGAVNLTLDPQASAAFLTAQTVQAIADNPRTVNAANTTSQARNYGRRQQAALSLSPSQVFG